MNSPPNRNGEFMERRIHPRFRVQKGAYAAINDGFYKIGQIQNISKSGLAFKYMERGEKVEGTYRVDIFSSDNDFFLKNIPFRTISDFFEETENPFITVSIRQCGGKFGELTPGQRSQINYFIENYTLAKA
jgi:hypothetical protein